MSTNHNHTFCCEHANMAYCKHCRRPYCKDCGYEWAQYNYWYNGYPWTYTSGSTYGNNELSYTVKVDTNSASCSGKHEE